MSSQNDASGKQFFQTIAEAYSALAYVPTATESAQIAKHYADAERWIDRGEKALWDTDGFSLTAFVSGPAAEDERKKAHRIQTGEMGVFRVFIRLSDMQIVATEPEEVEAYGRPGATEWKWVVRNEQGRMQRDDGGRWMVYPVNPKRAGTHEKRGFAERYAVLPYKLVDRKESIGAAMKRGIGASQLDRVPVLRNQ